MQEQMLLLQLRLRRKRKQHIRTHTHARAEAKKKVITVAMRESMQNGSQFAACAYMLLLLLREEVLLLQQPRRLLPRSRHRRRGRTAPAGGAGGCVGRAEAPADHAADAERAGRTRRQRAAATARAVAAWRQGVRGAPAETCSPGAARVCLSLARVGHVQPEVVEHLLLHLRTAQASGKRGKRISDKKQEPARSMLETASRTKKYLAAALRAAADGGRRSVPCLR